MNADKIMTKRLAATRWDVRERGCAETLAYRAAKYDWHMEGSPVLDSREAPVAADHYLLTAEVLGAWG